MKATHRRSDGAPQYRTRVRRNAILNVRLAMAESRLAYRARLYAECVSTMGRIGPFLLLCGCWDAPAFAQRTLVRAKGHFRLAMRPTGSVNWPWRDHRPRPHAWDDGGEVFRSTSGPTMIGSRASWQSIGIGYGATDARNWCSSASARTNPVSASGSMPGYFPSRPSSQKPRRAITVRS